MISNKITVIVLYLILIIVFYGFSNNHGFHIEPNKIKTIATFIFAVIMFLFILFIR